MNVKKLAAGALAALTLAGGAAATATPAAAQPWRGGGYHHSGWGPGAAIGAGLVGLAVGAAIADHPHYAYGYGPDYGPGGYGCRTAVRWNPYWGHYERVRACY